MRKWRGKQGSFYGGGGGWVGPGGGGGILSDAELLTGALGANHHKMAAKEDVLQATAPAVLSHRWWLLVHEAHTMRWCLVASLSTAHGLCPAPPDHQSVLPSPGMHWKGGEVPPV